MLRQLYSCYCI